MQRVKNETFLAATLAAAIQQRLFHFINSHSQPPLSLIICPHHRNLGTYGGPLYDTPLCSSLIKTFCMYSPYSLFFILRKLWQSVQIIGNKSAFSFSVLFYFCKHAHTKYIRKLFLHGDWNRVRRGEVTSVICSSLWRWLAQRPHVRTSMWVYVCVCVTAFSNPRNKELYAKSPQVFFFCRVISISENCDLSIHTRRKRTFPIFII